MVLVSLYGFDEDYTDLFACERFGEVEVGAVAFGAGAYGLVQDCVALGDRGKGLGADLWLFFGSHDYLDPPHTNMKMMNMIPNEVIICSKSVGVRMNRGFTIPDVCNKYAA